MNEEAVKSIIDNQREYFKSGKTLPVSRRIEVLKKLKAKLEEYEALIAGAIKADLGKSWAESYMCETGMVLSELSFMIKHVKRYAKERTVPTPLAQFAARSYVKSSPYGVVLVMSPWNYPFMLSMEPLIDAVAAGNTVVLKPSAYSPNTSTVLAKIISECFDEGQAAVVEGGREENQCLLKQKFDYIFFTGSQEVGKFVMRCASEKLTPVTLELGGKSPCIVDKTADIKLAAKRIVFGKYLNCGQTCVAPDYVLCDESVKESFISEVKKQISMQFGEKPLENEMYGRIINLKHFERINALIDYSKIVYGGKTEPNTLKIEPTVMDNVTWGDKVMQEEIFGPVMPVLAFKSIDEVIAAVNSGKSPLALYIFSSDKAVIKEVTSRCKFGGGCVNDTIIHLATSRMGFGGVGESGMGAYHGRIGFDTFSHKKSIVDKKTWIDMPVRYQPYTEIKNKLVRFFMK